MLASSQIELVRVEQRADDVNAPRISRALEQVESLRAAAVRAWRRGWRLFSLSAAATQPAAAEI